MKIIILFLVFAIPIGCAHQKPFTIMDAKDQCATYGFKQDTPEYSNCLMNAMNQQKTLKQQRGAAAWQTYQNLEQNRQLRKLNIQNRKY